MAEKSPAFQFYPKDWLTDEKVLAMTPAERGEYITLLCVDWLNDGLKEGFWPGLNQGSTLVRSCFVDHPTKAGYLTNPRLQKERQKQASWREKSSNAGKESGKARKLKALQNEPNANQSPTKREPNGNSSSSTPSSSNNISLPVAYLAEPKEHEFTDPNIAKWMKPATEHLEPLLDPPSKWQLDNRYINAGRRPMKKYPHVFLSAPELAEVFRQYDEVGLTPLDARQAFQAVSGRLITLASNGSSNNSISVFNWLIGWAKQEVLESKIKEHRLKNAKEGYAKQNTRR